jgi:branched-chain amino acid transport system substrate-binding protein
MKRREILKIGAAAAGLGFPAVIRAQQKEVVILGLWDQTGAFADVGPLNDRGMRMALEERDMKILGRPIKYVTRDGATQAGTSTRRAEEAIDGEGARFLVGPWSSGVALAVSEVAKRKKVLHFFSGGTEDISGARCHRYSFQWAASPYTAAKTVVDNFMKANPKARRWSPTMLLGGRSRNTSRRSARTTAWNSSAPTAIRSASASSRTTCRRRRPTVPTRWR